MGRSRRADGHTAGSRKPKLNGALRKVIDSPDIQAKFKNVGFEGFSSTSAELGDYMKAEIVDWGKMVKDAGIQPD